MKIENMQTNKSILQGIVLISIFLISCDKKNEEVLAPPITITVDPSTTYQTIAGFGGGNAMWGTNYLTPSQIQTAFGTGDNELGLSIFRVRLSSVQSEWSLVAPVIKEVKKYGAKILASPWSPPADLKNNNNVIGGYLLPENYGAYAAYINAFTNYMDSQGATIDAVSIQNEPDIQVSYESCDWTADQVYNFIKDFGGTIQGTKVAAAESFNFKQSYTNMILNDATAVENLDIVAGHIYGNGQAPYPLAVQKGKEIWMTEYLLNLNSGNVPSNWDTTEAAIWSESLDMLRTVHTAMNNNWNAYLWWYIRRYYSFLGDGEHGTTTGSILKRGYAFSQYSKFVRPGYLRIGMQSDNSTTLLATTVYKGDHKIVAVMINSQNSTIPVTLITPDKISAAEAYSTSVSLNRDKKNLSPEENKVSVIVPPLSITTAVLSY